MRKQIEQLETRRVMASDWQCQPNPLDVDASGFVAALDVLLIVNDLNSGGTRALPPTRPVGYSGPLMDVSGDGVLSPLDVLQVVNAINQFPNAPTLDVGLTDASDGNHDQVVLSRGIRYEGTTSPQASVSLQVFEGEQSSTIATTIADSLGHFQFDTQLTGPIQHLRVIAMDVRGRSVATERVVRLGDVITSWNATILEATRESTNISTTIPGLLIKPPPPMVAKGLAMIHIAMFDAINAIQPRYQGYAFQGPAVSTASSVAAAATAAHHVANHLYPNSPQLTELFNATLAETLGQISDGPAKSAGIDVGQRAAQAIIAARSNDGASDASSYQPVNLPGHWNPTPPNFAAATLPQWPEVTPFVLTSGFQFRPASPPSLTSAEYAASVDQVHRIGSLQSSERTNDQKDIALFWADGGGTSTPPGHWNQIAMDVALEQNMALLERARMMALLNLSLADAGIASWDAKYAYDLWRPIDAIREADTDGNALTTVDRNWTPLLATPSFPSYTSGHSTFSAAAATVLESIFGQNFVFETRADRGFGGKWPPADDVALLPTRSFSSFQAAAEEAGMSRIYGGIHYAFDNSAGLSSGRAVGQWVIAHALRPLA